MFLLETLNLPRVEKKTNKWFSTGIRDLRYDKGWMKLYLSIFFCNSLLFCNILKGSQKLRYLKAFNTIWRGPKLKI